MTALNGRVARLEAALVARPGAPHWWAGVPAPVLAYLAAQPAAVAEAFGRHLDAMQLLPGNRDRFRYYQVLNRPWRAGGRRFLAPALLVYDAIFTPGPPLTLRAAQVRVLACGYHNLRDATPETGTAAASAAERYAAAEARRDAVWARLAGAPLCAAPSCMCFVSTGWRCRDPAGAVAAWRERGTADPATLAAMGFGEPERAFLAIEDEGEVASDAT